MWLHLRNQFPRWVIFLIEYILDILSFWYFNIVISTFIHLFHFIILQWKLRHFPIFLLNFLIPFKHYLFLCSNMRVKLKLCIQIKKAMSQKHPYQNSSVIPAKKSSFARNSQQPQNTCFLFSRNPEVFQWIFP